MRARTSWIVRVGAALFMICALVGIPGAVSAAPSADQIVYVVQPGDRLVDIAARHGVSASAIVRANNLANADQIYPGQRLIIPAAGAAPALTPTPAPTPAATAAASPPPQSRPASYTVQPGDTLASIARKFGVSTASLQQANGIRNADQIWVGQKLVIPGGASGSNPSPAKPTAKPSASQPTPGPTAEAPAQPPAQVIHVVRAGETLSQIAKRYGVSVDALVSENGLGSPDMIRVGMRLIIPGKGGATTGSVGRATKFVASISQQRCWLYSGETVIARWICSTGRRGAATRPGSYKIQSKLPKAYGSTWNIWMPFWLGIYWAGASENGIHGLPWDAKTGVTIWSGNVGSPITFGCVMLDNVNAKMLYDMAWIGMPVIVRQ
jgi:LysM repeat protein